MALPLEGALSPNNCEPPVITTAKQVGGFESPLRGKAPMALPLEGALSPNNCEPR